METFVKTVEGRTKNVPVLSVLHSYNTITAHLASWLSGFAAFGLFLGLTFGSFWGYIILSFACGFLARHFFKVWCPGCLLALITGLDLLEDVSLRKVEQVAEQTVEKAEELKAEIVHKVEDSASLVGEKAKDLKNFATETVSTIAEKGTEITRAVAEEFEEGELTGEIVETTREVTSSMMEGTRTIIQPTFDTTTMTDTIRLTDTSNPETGKAERSNVQSNQTAQNKILQPQHVHDFNALTEQELLNLGPGIPDEEGRTILSGQPTTQFRTW